MIFNIDLLKGKGRPAKSRPESMAVAAIAVIIPAVVAIIFLSIFLGNRVAISIKKNEIASYQKRLESEKLADAVKFQKSVEDEKKLLTNGISEVASNIGSRIQWSPVIETILKNLPESLAMTVLEVKEETKKVKKPKADEPGKMTDVPVAIKTLHMGMVANSQNNYDVAVKQFRSKLIEDSWLGPKLEDIRVAQEFEKVNDRQVVSYQIFLVFKPSI